MRWGTVAEWVARYPHENFVTATRSQDSTATTPDTVVLQAHLDRAKGVLVMSGAGVASCHADVLIGAQYDLAMFYLLATCRTLTEESPALINYRAALEFCKELSECAEKINAGVFATPSAWVVGGSCAREFTAESLECYAPRLLTSKCC